ncbi:MAG: hypothetical protein RBG13Loki_2709 [Promethearchaeota archaeon CR_4]|nr:MAG: hypothetical protein RBG13Loki_2709 [Candidatus Lokiarchaeota archaeon CR_4]
MGPLSYNELTDAAIDNTDKSIPTIHRHIARLFEQGKLIKHKQPKRAGVTYELSEVGIERYRQITQKRKKEHRSRALIPPDAKVQLFTIVNTFCAGTFEEVEFERRTLQRCFAELLSYDKIFPKDFCPAQTLYAILGNLALKDPRNIFSPIPDDEYARAVGIPVEDIAYFRKEFFKRVFIPSPDSNSEWITSPDYEDFLLPLINFALDNWNNGDTAWRRDNTDWRHDRESLVDLRQALPSIISDIRRILEVVEQPPAGNPVWEANTVRLIKKYIEMLGGETSEDRAPIKNLLEEVDLKKIQMLPEAVKPVNNSPIKMVRKAAVKKSRVATTLACDICGEQYPLARLKTALEAGKMKCSCGNDLTAAARNLLDNAEK